MSSTPMPQWKIPPILPVFMTALPDYARKLRCRVQYYTDLDSFHQSFLQEGLCIIEISPDCAVLVIGRKAVPREFDQIPHFKFHLESFMEEYAFPLILWQGYQDTFTRLSENRPKIALALRGMIMRHSMTYRQALIPTRHIEDTALCLRSLAKRVQIIDNPPSTARIKKKATTLYDAQLTLLEGLCLMGPKKVKALSTEFSSPADIFAAIQTSEILYTRTGNPKGITGPFAPIKLFHHEFIRQNQTLLFTPKP